MVGPPVGRRRRSGQGPGAAEHFREGLTVYAAGADGLHSWGLEARCELKTEESEDGTGYRTGRRPSFSEGSAPRPSMAPGASVDETGGGAPLEEAPSGEGFILSRRGKPSPSWRTISPPRGGGRRQVSISERGDRLCRSPGRDHSWTTKVR